MTTTNRSRSDAADRIKAAVTVPRALRFYGVDVRGKRIPCPLHRGTHNNFALTDRSFKCFVCGGHGSVIDLVMRLFDLPFHDAARKLDSDFSLGIYGEKVDAIAEYRRKYEKKSLQAEREKREAELRTLLAEHRRLHAAFLRGDPDEEEYVEACRKLETLSYIIDNFEIEG